MPPESIPATSWRQAADPQVPIVMRPSNRLQVDPRFQKQHMPRRHCRRGRDDAEPTRLGCAGAGVGAATASTSSRTRGSRHRLRRERLIGVAADVWPVILGAAGASSTCSGRRQTVTAAATGTRTRGSRRRLPAGKG